MEQKLTFGNNVLIKLDKENDSIQLRNGFELFVDITFDPEKHATITGEVYGLPSRLQYTGKANIGMPWLIDMEVRFGDKVIMYYLSVVNAFKPENRKYILEGEDRYVFIPYDKIYAVFGEGFVRPINGYCLVELVDDPFVEEQKTRMKKIGLEAVLFNKKSNTNVTFGKVKYIGTPNREYVDENSSDDGVDVKIGDIVVLRKTYDIPLEYGLHAKIEKEKGLLRVQRRNLLAKI